MTDRDLARLTGVHPALIEALREMFSELAQWGHPLFVVQGVRTMTEQQKLFQIGRDPFGKVTGKVVTYKDGVFHKSDHQPHADGFGHAVDAAFLGGDPFAQTHPWQTYGEAAEKRGLRWGGRFLGLRDCPHVELPELAGAKIA